MTETDRAYLAGLIDGEGCFSGHYVNDKPQLAIVVQMGSEEIIEWLHSHFGGIKRVLKEETVRTQKLWCWRTNGINCKPVIEAILPYLKLKKKQALFALAFVHLMEETTTPGIKVSEEVWNKRTYLVEQIRSLSSVGQRKTREQQAVN